ncbi:6-phosphofructo-2-kinase-domain-containing protein [Paraphysoderma sedebokerense]|nr:6-phosphofructo-2-kinase-domain-containing protein [Paraphysoderma sedebokerense]
MVGLPARGKSYICKKLKRYMSWLGFNTRVFNVGNRRRTSAEEEAKKENKVVEHNSDFFDPNNKDASSLRDRLAMDTLEELLEWLHSGGKCGIHDATNTTVARRMKILERCKKERNVKVLFLESICTDETVLAENIRMKLQSPDYRNMNPDAAIADFKARMSNYERAYQPLGDFEEKLDLSYIKVINVGKKIVEYNIQGYLPSQIVFYLMNVHINERTIWLTRHGESVHNIAGVIGGDSSLSENGQKYAKALARFLQERYPTEETEQVDIQDGHGDSESNNHESPNNTTAGIESLPTKTSDVSTSDPNSSSQRLTPPRPPVLSTINLPLNKSSGTSQSSPSHSILDLSHSLYDGLYVFESEEYSNSKLVIWTSMLRRTLETVEHFDPNDYEIRHSKILNEIYAGSCENLTPQEIETQFPGEVVRRQANKLCYRYPGMGGESYLDVIERLKPVIIETERTVKDILIVTHNVVMRTLLSYYLGLPLEEMTVLDVPLHTLYALKPKPYGTELQKWKYLVDKDEFIQVE